MCDGKYVYMDQGGELLNNPEVKNLLTKSGYTIHPTGTDASCQNVPAKRGHQTITDTVPALLTGENMSMKFWLCAFYHDVCFLSCPLNSQCTSNLLRAHYLPNCQSYQRY